jgi:hypothetical protein
LRPSTICYGNPFCSFGSETWNKETDKHNLCTSFSAKRAEEQFTIPMCEVNPYSDILV